MLDFLLDYVNGGELFTHLYQREKFSEDEVRIYIGEIVVALEHLHRVGNSQFPFITFYIRTPLFLGNFALFCFP